MRSEDEINEAINAINLSKDHYPGQSYTQGVRDALDWVLEDLSDEEFEVEALR